MKNLYFLSVFVFAVMATISCNDSQPSDKPEAKLAPQETAAPKIKEEAVSYTDGGTTLNSYIVYDENKEGARPAVLVIPEWWGLDDYPRSRARQLASLGYIAMAVDMYGNGKIAADPKEAMSLAGPFYKSPELSRSRIDAALKKLKEYSRTDSSKIAVIGYCFGGNAAINAAKLGSGVIGVVSFHGGLAGPAPDKNTLKAKFLICHGGDDKFVGQAEVDAFKKSMDSVGADYKFIVYPGATHAFTNRASDENGKKFNMPIAYNAAADSASWKDMKEFFGRIF